MNQKLGRLFVLTGPSGAGTGEVIKSINNKRTDIGFVIPVTARKMKQGDENGKGLYFYDLDGWDELKASGDLLECTEFAGNDYGTSRKLVMEQLEKGLNVVLDLEVSRAEQIKNNMPESVCILVVPSDQAVLEERYTQKARNRYEVPVRMAEAKIQIEKASFCDYTVYSDDLEKAAEALDQIITAEDCRTEINKNMIEDLD